MASSLGEHLLKVALRATFACISNAQQLDVNPETTTQTKPNTETGPMNTCPPPIIHYLENDWVDITNEFFSACKDLEQGEVAVAANFGLFEAMTAIEIMAPRTDTGVGYNKKDNAPHTFAACVEAGVLKIANLTSEELVGIMDAIFACLVSWLEGNSIDRSLFICLYLHEPGGIADETLQSFCVAACNLISLIKKIVLQSGVSEDEYFDLEGSLVVDNNKNPEQVTVQLKKAEDKLARYLKTISEESTVNNTKAVVHRLRFMRHFLQSIHCFVVATETSAEENIMGELKRNLNFALELITFVKSSIERGTQPAEGSGLPNPMGFSLAVNVYNQRLPFHRKMEIGNRMLSYQFLECLVHRLKNVCTIIKCRDFQSVYNIFIEYGQTFKDCILSRSLMQNLLCTNRRLIFGTIPVQDFIWDALRIFSNSPVLNPKCSIISNLNVIHQRMERFLCNTETINAFLELIRTCAFKQSFQRERLALCIKNLELVRAETINLDHYLNVLSENSNVELEKTALELSIQNSNWMLYICGRANMMYLFLGFEFELYATHEYVYIYWYSHEILFPAIVKSLSHAEMNLAKVEELLKKIPNGAGKGKKPQHNPKKNKRVQGRKSHRLLLMLFHALLSICSAFYKAMAGLTKDGHVRQPMPDFNNEETRFNHRFAPFNKLGMALHASYAEFKSSRDALMALPTPVIYKIASQSFVQAFKLLELITFKDEEISDLMRIVKVSYATMLVLAQGIKKDCEIVLDHSLHSNFPAIIIKKI